MANGREASKKDNELSMYAWVDLINLASHCKRSSIKFTIQTFDPAFGIGELQPEIFYFLMVSSLTLAEVQKLIDTLYRCTELKVTVKDYSGNWLAKLHAPRSKQSLRFA